MKIDEYKQETKVAPETVEKRKLLYKLYKNTPLPIEQLLINLGLYMRSGVLAKTLFINELYELILPIPGVIMEFGIWWGHNIILKYRYFKICYIRKKNQKRAHLRAVPVWVSCFKKS